jgi:hypothetical protein
MLAAVQYYDTVLFQSEFLFAGFYVLTPVVIKRSVLRDIYRHVVR